VKKGHFFEKTFHYHSFLIWTLESPCHLFLDVEKSKFIVR